MNTASSANFAKGQSAPQHLLMVSLHLWWRWTWRMFLAGVIIVALPSIALIAAVIARSRAGGDVALGLYAIGFGLYAWQMGEIMRRHVFAKPIRMGGVLWAPTLFNRGEAVATPMSPRLAWTILWAINWRAMMMATMNAALGSIVVRLLDWGPQSAASGPQTAGGATIVFIVASIVTQLAAYAWFIAAPYGKSRVILAVQPEGAGAADAV
ncbi:MAG: hypothetical protein HKL99_07235 [Burkholderiales bacterium]|nr:hypothetical protein [Burkholderiales bacterium]